MRQIAAANGLQLQWIYFKTVEILLDILNLQVDFMLFVAFCDQEVLSNWGWIYK